MPENFDINLLLERKPVAAARRQLIETIARVAAPWFSHPHTVMVQTLSSGAAIEQPWLAWSASAKDGLGEDCLLHVYEEGSGDLVSSLTVEEGSSAAVYGLSIPLKRLQGIPLRKLEDLSQQLYDAASHLSPVAIIAGVEYTAEVPTGTLEEAVREALRDTSLMTTLVLPRLLVLPRNAPFESVQAVGERAVFRHTHAAARTTK